MIWPRDRVSNLLGPSAPCMCHTHTHTHTHSHISHWSLIAFSDFTQLHPLFVQQGGPLTLSMFIPLNSVCVCVRAHVYLCSYASANFNHTVNEGQRSLPRSRTPVSHFAFKLAPKNETCEGLRHWQRQRSCTVHQCRWSTHRLMSNCYS